MIEAIKHGGNLREATQHYQIPLKNWLDLSTGINPNGWQPPHIPAHIWQRLPEENDGLLEAARAYYGTPHLLALAGSQAAIQSLPYCRSHARVGIVAPAYAEYDYCWRKAGHEVIAIGRDEVTQHLDSLDVLIVINPNNPDTYLHACETLLRWQQQLAQRGGWLIVDEAFMDSTPEQSLLQYGLENYPNLIVLRSLGKFFGLAGLRLGFIAAQPKILKQVKQLQGTWPISHPSRWLGKKALLDTQWQAHTRQQLPKNSQQLHQVLNCISDEIYCTNLFCYFRSSQAEALKIHCAQQGIWLRSFVQPHALRIGLSKDLAAMNHLYDTLLEYKNQTKQ